MFSVARQSTIPHIVPKNLTSRTHVRRSITPVRVIPETITSYSVQDFSEYASTQVIAWMLPMTIAGRAMGMEYKNICQGLCIIAVAKVFLKEAGIIHF